MSTSVAESFSRSRTADSRRPSRSTATVIRTSWRSGCSATHRVSSGPGSPSGSVASAAGGSISRSTVIAQPATASGQAIVARNSSSGAPAGNSSCSTGVRPLPPPRSSWSASPGSSDRSRSVSTSANSWAGRSQPSPAAYSSISSTALVSAVVADIVADGVSGTSGGVLSMGISCRLVPRKREPSKA